MKYALLRLGTQIEWKTSRNDNVWFGVCDALKLVAIGKTYSSLTEEIHRTMEVLFKDLISRGNLAVYLEGIGWESIRVFPKIDLKTLEKTKLDVPVNIFEITLSQN